MRLRFPKQFAGGAETNASVAGAGQSFAAEGDGSANDSTTMCDSESRWEQGNGWTLSSDLSAEERAAILDLIGGSASNGGLRVYSTAADTDEAAAGEPADEGQRATQASVAPLVAQHSRSMLSMPLTHINHADQAHAAPCAQWP